jgi:hypothetical protein
LLLYIYIYIAPWVFCCVGGTRGPFSLSLRVWYLIHSLSLSLSLSLVLGRLNMYIYISDGSFSLYIFFRLRVWSCVCVSFYISLGACLRTSSLVISHHPLLVSLPPSLPLSLSLSLSLASRRVASCSCFVVVACNKYIYIRPCSFFFAFF